MLFVLPCSVFSQTLRFTLCFPAQMTLYLCHWVVWFCPGLLEVLLVCLLLQQLACWSNCCDCFILPIFACAVNDVEESEGLPSLDKPGWYSQGNWPHLHELLKKMTGKPEPKVHKPPHTLQQAARALAHFEVSSNFSFWQALKEMKASW